MKKQSIFIVIMLFLVFIGGHSVLAESNNSLSKSEILDLEREINEVMNQELEGNIQSDYDSVTTYVENITIELKESTLELYDYNRDNIINAFKQEAEKIKEGFKNSKVEIEKNESKETNDIGIQSIVDKGTYYVARVWAGVPNAGWGWINQDFTVFTKNNRISSVNLLRDSYDSGFLLSHWTPIRSWFDIHKYGITGDIFMKGTTEYIIKGSTFKATNTFKKTISAYDF